MAVQVKTKFTKNQLEVQKQIKTAKFENITQAAASIRKLTIARIGSAPQGVPSEPGTPPHTHRKAYYRRAVFFDVDKQKENAVIGFRRSKIGMAASLQEHGLEDPSGKFTFPERPVIGPALIDSLPRIANQWQGSIGS